MKHSGTCLVTERDRAIFKFLFENKVAGIQQLQAALFCGISVQTTCRRLMRLHRSGWIQRLGHSEAGKLHTVYSLAEPGYRQFIQAEGESDSRQQLKSDSVAHDLALLDIRLAMQKNTAVCKFTTENMLQSNPAYLDDEEAKSLVGLRSDAMVELLAKNGSRIKVPLEFEASLKSKERCTSKLLNYYLAHKGSVVLFVCKDEIVLDRMVEVEKSICQKREPKMHFALLENVLASPEKITFSKAQGQKVTLP